MKQYDYMDVDVFCPICNNVMSAEGNVFVLNYFCENPKCKGYLKRHGGISKSLTGKIDVTGYKYKVDPKGRQERIKEDVSFYIGIGVTIVVLITIITAINSVS